MSLLRFAGIAGLVVFFFGVIGGFVVDFAHPLMLLHLVLGAALMVTWGVMVGGKAVAETGQIVKGRHVRFGANVVAYATVFLGLVVALNWFANQRDEKWDLTEEKVYSLSDQSSKVLEGLQKPLKLVAFKGAGGQSGDDQALEDLFERYEGINKAKVSAEIIDPRAKPHLVDKYGMNPGNLVYIRYGEGEDAPASRINEGTEEAITNAILKLTRGESKKVYFVEGHGEPGIDQGEQGGVKELAAALKDEAMNVEGILLSTKGAVPEDAAAVVLLSPKQAMPPEEKKILVDYANQGGRLLILHDPRNSGDTKDLAAQFGITIADDVVIDQIQRLFNAPALGAQPVATEYDTTHPITKNFTRRNVTIYNIASSVSGGSTKDGVTYTSLVQSSQTAWGETDLSALLDRAEPSAERTEADVPGPVTLAVAYEKKLSSSKEGEGAAPAFDKVSRVVVFGDSDWVLNGNIRAYSNRDLLLNTVGWLAGEEGGVSIRAGSIRASAAPIPEATFMMILASSFLIPELILLVGLLVWYHRRAASV